MREFRPRRRSGISDWNLLIRAISLAIALGITLILIVSSMPKAPANTEAGTSSTPSALKWTVSPKDQGALVEVPTEVTGDLPGGETSTDIPTSGSGNTQVVSGTAPGNGKGHIYYYRVEVEEGLPINKNIAAQSIHQILNDPRGWGGPGGEISFTRTDGEADFRIVLASPTLTDTLCAPLATLGVSNCRNGSNVVLNAKRWVNGAQMWFQMGKTITDYRIYEVSHETGHWLGHGHVGCPAAGALAPTMKQQSSDTGNNDGCIPNGWPNP